MDSETIRLTRLTSAEASKPAEADLSADEAAARIVADVRARGDDALRHWARELDKVGLDSLEVPLRDWGGAGAPDGAEAARACGLEETTFNAIRSSALRIKRFSETQLKQFRSFETEVEDGVILGQRMEPIESVGVYVPAGRYPLVSTTLMGVCPARVAGVRRIVVMTPPQADGKPHPAIVAAAEIAGATELRVSGGAQAIAALAFGTQTLRRVDKIVGPGNKYVAAAKRLVASSGAVSIDFNAGPSEVLIVADRGAKAEIVAADLAAQSEHDVDARAILVTDSEELLIEVEAALTRLASELASGAVIRESLARHGSVIMVKDIDEAAAVSNAIAPEHLELQVQDVRWILPLFRTYGSVFLGAGAGEVLGDYSSGLNHTLPTSGAARWSAGLSVRDFVCLRTSLEVRGGRGKKVVSQDAVELAKLEGLSAHEYAARLRAKD